MCKALFRHNIWVYLRIKSSALSRNLMSECWWGAVDSQQPRFPRVLLSLLISSTCSLLWNVRCEHVIQPESARLQRPTHVTVEVTADTHWTEKCCVASENKGEWKTPLRHPTTVNLWLPSSLLKHQTSHCYSHHLMPETWQQFGLSTVLNFKVNTHKSLCMKWHKLLILTSTYV